MNKLKVNDLAFFGGKPMFELPLHVGRPNEVDRHGLLERLTGVLDRKWLTNDGPLVRHFEAQLADFLSVDQCVLVSSATVGLQVLAKALGLSGDVLLPAFTFIGTAHALAWIGLKPILCDVDPRTHNISAAETLRKATSRTCAVLGVHLWGRSCDVKQLEGAARRLNVPLIFDAAHAVGCSYHSRPLGGFGVAEVFSLHATKCITSLEGGAITTNDPKLAQEVRLLRNFGFSGEDTVCRLGINAKMNEFSAAMGIASLASYQHIRDHNEMIHESYHNKISSLENICLLRKPSNEAWNYHYAIIELRERSSSWRDLLHKILGAENILARRYFTPGVHRSPPYSLRRDQGQLNVSNKLANTLLALPTGTQMDRIAAERIGDLIQFCQLNRNNIEATYQEKTYKAKKA